ncbi:MAG: hypothetical protein AAF206_18575 [Bacteroidota bacterium]
MIYSQPGALLGEAVYRKFGDELPIYFEFVDTSEGKNLQVETFAGPDFLAENFGLKNRQHISYYVMSGQKGSHIHIGLKRDVSVEYFKQLLNNHQKARVKEITSLLHKIPLKEHDFLSIPTETILSNGKKSILLRISTASSIFRYELFRQKSSQKGLLHPQTEALIDIASQKNTEEIQIQASAKQGFVNLQNSDSSSVLIQQYWLDSEATFDGLDSVCVFNLVSGREILVEGPFEAFRVYHSESFVMPAAIEQFRIRPLHDEPAGILQVLPSV